MKKNYWKEQADQNKWIVVGSDMDGLTGYQVVHSTHAHKIRSGCYWGGIVEGFSLDKEALQKVADKLNAENKQPSNDPLARL
jgi:hypothetical protein